MCITSHYDAKALPSAGLMPLFQSYLCSFTNPCYKSPRTGDDTAQINSETRKQSLIVATARAIAEMFVAIGSEPLKWFNLSDSIISFINIFAHFTPYAFDQPIPLIAFFNSTDDAIKFFKSTLNSSDELSVSLSNVRITPLYALEIIKEINLLCNLVSRAISSVYPEDIVNSNLLYEQLGSKISQFFMQHNANETNTMALKALYNWLKFASINNMSIEYEEMLKMFNTLHIFGNDQVIRKFTSALSMVDFSNHTSIINAIHCGNNPYDQNSHEEKSIPGATATVANNTDKDEIYNFLRRVTPRYAERHDKKKQFCGVIPINSDKNCSFLEGAALSQLMPLINAYILLAPFSPVINAFAEKMQETIQIDDYSLSQATLDDMFVSLASVLSDKPMVE
ncbi:unnamed protein product [Acanthocheilonema viteae]|uniref:Uncharacterized protein n=1 Tax=Acanthocheilonema viteae TaxID=6277 RepID=A0A498S718_ACAVI|nr:unnamed protein product [Acanthocheilonema viteae]